MLLFELLSLERPYYDLKDRFQRNQCVIDGVRPKFPPDCRGLNDRCATALHGAIVCGGSISLGNLRARCRDPRIIQLFMDMTGKTAMRPDADAVLRRLSELEPALYLKLK